MVNAGGAQNNKPEIQDDAQRLIRRSRMWEILTFAAVILISPVSFILGLPFGISPHDWLASWTHWTVVFITIAFFIALLGFETALSYKLKAQRISKTGHS
jgi:membrane protein YdbS with pleckstrin-like domain